MATTNQAAVGNDKVAAGDPLAGIMNMLTKVTGTKTVTNPGETDVLRQSVAGLRQQDPQAMLQTIFQQAAGNIPGIQAAMSNAIGARSGSNSAVAAALQKLLQQTTIAAQQQMATQQLQNLQQQAQAGQAIAQTTRGTTTTSTPTIGAGIKSGANDLAKGVAALTLLNQLTQLTGVGSLKDVVKRVGSSMGVTEPATATTSATQTAMQPAAATPISSGGPAMSMAPAGFMQQPGLNVAALLGGGVPEMSVPAELPAIDIMPQAGPQMSMAPEGFIPQFNIANLVPASPLAGAPDQMSMAPAEMFAPALDITQFIQPEMAFTPDAGAYDFGSNWWE